MAKIMAFPKAPRRNSPSRWQGEDPIFFHRSQIGYGTKLINFGRAYHGSAWEVIKIRTWTISGLLRKVLEVTKLSDEITLRDVDTGEIRTHSFAALSYSAIWRLL